MTYLWLQNIFTYYYNTIDNFHTGAEDYPDVTADAQNYSSKTGLLNIRNSNRKISEYVANRFHIKPTVVRAVLGYSTFGKKNNIVSTGYRPQPHKIISINHSVKVLNVINSVVATDSVRIIRSVFCVLSQHIDN